jgi:hypothetical protein
MRPCSRKGFRTNTFIVRAIILPKQSQVLLLLACFQALVCPKNNAIVVGFSRFLDSWFVTALSFDPSQGRSYNRPVLAALSLPAGAQAPDGRGTGDALEQRVSSSGCSAIGSEGCDSAPTAG